MPVPPQSAAPADVKVGLLRSRFIAEVHEIVGEMPPDGFLTELTSMYNQACEIVTFQRAMNE